MPEGEHEIGDLYSAAEQEALRRNKHPPLSLVSAIHALMLCVTRGYGYHSPLTIDAGWEEEKLEGRRRKVAG